MNNLSWAFHLKTGPFFHGSAINVLLRVLWTTGQSHQTGKVQSVDAIEQQRLVVHRRPSMILVHHVGFRFF